MSGYTQITSYGSFDPRVIHASDEVHKTTGIVKREQPTSLSDLFAAATKAKDDVKKLPALQKALDNFPTENIKPPKGKVFSHINMLTHWELVLALSEAKSSGQDTPALREKVEAINNLVIGHFSSPDAYNRQRDSDVDEHRKIGSDGKRDCSHCRFFKIMG